MASVSPNVAPIEGYLERLMAMDATDLHITAGAPPLVRVDGSLRYLDESAQSPEDVERLVLNMLTPDLTTRLREHRAVDFSLNWKDRARFRANVYHQRGSLAFALRFIPYDIPSFDDLGLPAICSEVVQRHQGMVLVTGPTGSGKSTTQASMINWICNNRPMHVLTIEDPIEYVHRHAMGIVNQREVGDDVTDFAAGLRSALREDPDVVLVGEMRDLETIRSALTIAETGHLVFATLHTNDTAQAIDRITDVFPSDRQTLVRVQLAAVIEAVIYQRLLPRLGGGRVASFEVLKANSAVRNLIREGKSGQLRNVITMNQKEGMQTMEMNLNELVATGQVSFEEALARSLYPKELNRPITEAGTAV
jgi:twitching motility protein PilT